MISIITTNLQQSRNQSRDTYHRSSKPAHPHPSTASSQTTCRRRRRLTRAGTHTRHRRRALSCCGASRGDRAMIPIRRAREISPLFRGMPTSRDISRLRLRLGSEFAAATALGGRRGMRMRVCFGVRA